MAKPKTRGWRAAARALEKRCPRDWAERPPKHGILARLLRRIEALEARAKTKHRPSRE
jgi:hypothetical protein